MTNSPEKRRRKPKMAQGRKAGERPPDDPQDLLNNVIRTNKRLQEKKIMEILDRDKQED